MSTLASPPVFEIAERNGNRIALQSSDGHVAHLFVLEEDIVRLLVLPDGKLQFPKSWSIAPGAEDVRTEGRDRFDVSGFACPSFRLEASDGQLVVETSLIRLTLRLSGLHCRWEVLNDERWHPVCRDRPTQAYNFGWWDGKVHHYLARHPDEKYFGLGERTGALDRAGRRFRFTNVDAMGYDARTSDPLYKHIPFYLTWRPEAASAFGLFYDTLSDCSFDLGCERSNYHGLFRSFVADHGDLDYYFIAGPKIADVTRRFTWLTGRPAFLPKWSLGYSGSTMSYTDAPDAQLRMAEFVRKCEQHDILCDSFHLSSGYSSIGSKRYVFHWNKEKFPDPAAFARSYADKGIHLCPNIKPCLLRDHPLFDEARGKGLFICDASGEPAWVQFWGEIGAYLDFTNPDTLIWWKEKVTEALLNYGLDSTWNDNNEFEIVDTRARINFFGRLRFASEAKSLQPMMMMRASREAQRAHTPGKRPFVVSRSGSAGMQRYAQTWSGDNSTSWETLKYNLRMGLGLALSGISNSGHDIGGFAGPKPDTELFVRWVQCGLFLPRFSIHSWNEDGSANEPWMYPDAAATVAGLIKLRYRLLPTLYDLLWKHHNTYEPVVRPTFHDFPHDPRTMEENDEMMLGPSLLVAPVVTSGTMHRAVYLPRGPRWHDFWTGEVFAGGQTVARPATWVRPVMFAREGTIVALNSAEQHFAKPAFEPAFLLFLPISGTVEAEIFDDDGVSDAYRAGGKCVWRFRIECSEAKLKIRIDRDGTYLPSKQIRLLIPYGRRRTIEIESRRSHEETFEGGRSIVVEIA